MWWLSKSSEVLHFQISLTFTLFITIPVVNPKAAYELRFHLHAYFGQFWSWSLWSIWIIQSIWFEDVQITQVVGREMPLNLMLINDSLGQRLLCNLSFIDLLFHRTLNQNNVHDAKIKVLHIKTNSCS